MEKNLEHDMETTNNMILQGLGLAGNEGMEKKRENIIINFIATTMRIQR